MFEQQAKIACVVFLMGGSHMRAMTRSAKALAALTGLVLLAPTVGACGGGSKDKPKSGASASATAGSAINVDDNGKVTLPDGMSAGIVVYDREKKKVVVQSGQDDQFRSTSMVKLLFAIDYLRQHNPKSLDDATKTSVNAMLSSSEDGFASKIYNAGGRVAYLQKLVNEIKLTKTSAPPKGHSGWGAWRTTASDIVIVYQYILGDYAKSNAEASKFILEALKNSTKCAADGFNQSYGIPAVFGAKKTPWRAKQGWYQFSGVEKTPVDGCSISDSSEYIAVNNSLDKEYMHTTGLVGKDDRSIVVVLTSHTKGTKYDVAAGNVTALVGKLKLTA